jgi:hypothetical protein
LSRAYIGKSLCGDFGDVRENSGETERLVEANKEQDESATEHEMPISLTTRAINAAPAALTDGHASRRAARTTPIAGVPGRRSQVAFPLVSD